MKGHMRYGILPSLPDNLRGCIKRVKGKVDRTKRNGSSHSHSLLEIIHTNIL